MARIVLLQCGVTGTLLSVPDAYDVAEAMQQFNARDRCLDQTWLERFHKWVTRPGGPAVPVEHEHFEVRPIK